MMRHHWKADRYWRNYERSVGFFWATLALLLVIPNPVTVIAWLTALCFAGYWREKTHKEREAAIRKGEQR